MRELAGVFMGAVQYNEEGVFMSISDLCEVMTSTNGTGRKAVDAYNRLVKVAQVFYTPTDKTITPNKHTAQALLYYRPFPPAHSSCSSDCDHKMSLLTRYWERLNDQC